MHFKTVNGSITLDLPAEASATVRAETTNGEIETDFPLTVKGRFTHKRLSGTIGHGGRELDIVTVNGAIRLRRASDRPPDAPAGRKGLGVPHTATLTGR